MSTECNIEIDYSARYRYNKELIYSFDKDNKLLCYNKKENRSGLSCNNISWFKRSLLAGRLRKIDAVKKKPYVHGM